MKKRGEEVERGGVNGGLNGKGVKRGLNGDTPSSPRRHAPPPGDTSLPPPPETPPSGDFFFGGD